MDEIRKAAVLEGQTLTEQDLAQINKQTLRPLTEPEVFVFRVAACDNQVDREHERFTEKALAGLAKLFVGRTFISDHQWKTANQAARIYAAEVEQKGGLSRLILRVYMLRTEQTAAVIASIEGGILREVSVGCAVEKALCSVCGADRREKYCGHLPGKAYGGSPCHIDLDEAKDAYECSFVAVPAQPRAGIIKRYGGAGEPQEPVEMPENEMLERAKALLLLEEKRYGGMFQ